MQLPKPENPGKYVGLYVVDFGDQCAMGYTAEEVSILLESERFAEAKVFKIHRAQPNGQLELRGLSRECFHQESGMFFHCLDEESSRAEFQKLLSWSHEHPSPCRAKLQRTLDNKGQILIALIYPGQYEEEIGRWLQDSGFRGHGPVDAGPSQVQRFYDHSFEILQREQLWPKLSLETRSKEELLSCVDVQLQR